MIFEQGVYLIDHDPERTRGFYAQASDTSCDCQGCRNFRAAADRMPGALRALLEQFGIDPKKPAEMSVLYAPDQDMLSYNGFYHFCGALKEGLEPFIQTGPKSFQLDQRYLLNLGEDSIWFRADCALVDEKFPRPVVQAEVTFCLPWVLEEEHDYL